MPLNVDLLNSCASLARNPRSPEHAHDFDRLADQSKLKKLPSCGDVQRFGLSTNRPACCLPPEVALAEIDRVIASGVRFGCVLADSGYGSSGPFRQALSERGLHARLRQCCRCRCARLQRVHAPRRQHPPFLVRRNGTCDRRPRPGSARRARSRSAVDRSRHHARGPRQGLVPASELLESRAGVAIDRRHICTAYIQSHLQIRNLMYLVAHFCRSYGKTMQHRDFYPTRYAGLPAIRHGLVPACATEGISMKAPSEQRKLPA